MAVAALRGKNNNNNTKLRFYQISCNDFDEIFAQMYPLQGSKHIITIQKKSIRACFKSLTILKQLHGRF